MFRLSAIFGVIALTACNGDGPPTANPAPPPAATNTSDVDTPNALPESIMNGTVLNSGGGVIGVGHLPP